RLTKGAKAMHEIKENDVVALLVDLPEQDLRRGDAGTVIEAFARTAHHPAGFIVEFVDESGSVYKQADITDTDQLIRIRLNFRREAA
ncbi:MAG: DUF4926 domain-containing protein, partial [Pyrinomonadaceae bacterium]